MSSKIIILFLSHDIALARNLQDRTKFFTSEFMFLPCSTLEKLPEYPKKFQISAVILDDAFMDPLNPAHLQNIQQSIAAGLKPSVPMMLFSADRDQLSVRRVIEAGFVDVFIKPVDTSLFFQKLQMYLPQTRFLKGNLLFDMKVDSTLDLALGCQLTGASEFHVTLQVNRMLKPGEIFTLHGKLLGAYDGECMGRVMSCVLRPGESDKYEAQLMLLAAKKEILGAIRIWMKQEYIRTREKQL